ncbi:hypothetical protein ASPZODRAFT_2114127 [Penicilliopsis zonata CBS 506.65]|uniref:Uncharacterized protein n=1 Tax=Penicilliopsis zonata CBS 506.65 TaxID=1073090 RepID=A0A1L9S8U0_9EURO|nr:hypothetical protein ASPZODRAFT_2114127 [Penicilliopsis zonata CBS 506.65]OJJ43578.1 hypothetical protein ASPZODRAFT_2114127 [Penicilliopsis zonata CBS 506.65]
MHFLQTALFALAAVNTVSAWDLFAWHSKSCGTSSDSLYDVEGSTETGCFNFDMEDGYRIHALKAWFDEDKFEFQIYPAADCKKEGIWYGTEIGTGTCEVFEEWFSDVVIYSFKVTAL